MCRDSVGQATERDTRSRIRERVVRLDVGLSTCQ